MSIGGLVGAAVMGTIGFVITGFNPLGAYYGIAFGFALGMAIDPITPDMPSAGAPDQGDLVMSGEVGTPIADLAGTAKVAGHLLCYGGERAEPVYGEAAGGKGGGEPDPQITGYKYYMSWAVGIIAGQADLLYAVYKNDEVVWEGELDCPASGGEETITLDGMGSATFYFGTDDHALDSKVGALLDDPALNTPYRHLCWCFLDDCYIGEYNRAPTMKFVVKKIPANAFSDKHEIQTYDCNPAHAKWFILHDLTGLPESWLHSTDFAAEALTLWGESRGLSILFDRQQSALNYLESINSHIDSILRYGTDAKFHPKLIRDDYTVGDLPLIDEDVMLEEPTFDRRSWIDTINEMKVQYAELINVERLKPFGPMYGSGCNNDGQLGIDILGVSYRAIFTESVTSKLWLQVVCGNGFSIAICSDGTIYATGSNSYGQFGNGTTDASIIFIQTDTNIWNMLAADSRTVMALKSDGSLWGAGFNNWGQLGVDDLVDRHSFTQEITGKDWKFVGGPLGAATLAITTAGHLFGAGSEQSFSQRKWAAGYPAKILEFTQIKYDDGGAAPFPVDNSLWKFVAGSSSGAFAIKEDGTLWATGGNGNGQLGLGDLVTRYFFEQVGSSLWTSVSGEASTVAIKEDGTLWGWGWNGHGELGLDDIVQRTSPVQIGTDTWKKAVMSPGSNLLAIKSDDTIWGSGYNSHYELGLNHNNEVHVLTQEVNLQNWQDVCSDTNHSMAIEK